MRRFKPMLLASVVGLASIAVASPAVAQSNDGAAAANDEIVVTARLRQETLQEAPVALTSVNADTLEEYQIDEITDLTTRIPELKVRTGGAGSGGDIGLRGVASSSISAAFDSAVAFDYDGVQISTMRLVQVGFFDAAQIDVLKGPQSLFFGKSASAGVLSIRSADPTPTPEFGVSLAYEFEEKGMTGEAFASGPLSDTLGARVAVQYETIEDYIKLAPNTPAQNLDRGLENITARGTLDWEPSDRLSFNLKGTYYRRNGDGISGHSDSSCGADGVADPVYLLGGAVQFPSNADCDPFNGIYHLSDPHPGLNRLSPFSNPALRRGERAPFQTIDIYFGRLLGNIKLTDALTVTSTTGYLKFNSLGFDMYGTVGVPGGAAVTDEENLLDQFSQQLRLASDFDGPLNFMVGAFYEHRNIDFNASQTAINISLLVGADPLTGTETDYHKRHHTETDAYSAFGSATLDLTDRLQITGGLRYTKEKKVNNISIPYVHAALTSLFGFVPSGFQSPDIEFKDDNWSPEISVRYKLGDDIFLYGAYKTGFKSGGIDNSAIPSGALLGFTSPDPVVRQATADALTFGSETSEGGEIGFRSLLADRKIGFNATVYYYIFSDLQTQIFNSAALNFETYNASELTTKGVEADIFWKPLTGLTLSGAISYNHAAFTKPFVTGPGGDLEGRAPARSPRWSGNAGFDYTAPVGSSMKLGVSGNMSFSSAYLGNTQSFNDYRQGSFATFDGAVSIGAEDDRWKVSLVARNLTDKLVAENTGNRLFLPPGGDDQIIENNRGRQIFARVAFRF